jgi:hypothetical protein
VVQKRYVGEKTYKSVYGDYTIRGTAKKIAGDYLGLSNTVEGAEKEMLLQHSEHWRRVERGSA